MKKVLLLVMCIFGFQGASYGFLGTALNTESEKAFLKSLETHSGMTDEQAKELLLKAARLQQRLHKWSAAGAGVTVGFVAIVFYLLRNLLCDLEWPRYTKGNGWGLTTDFVHAAPCIIGFLGVAGLAFGKSLAAAIKSKKRADRYKKMAQRAHQLKGYQYRTEKCGSMKFWDPIKKTYTSTWNEIAQGRKKVMKKGLNAQLIGTSLGVLALIASYIAFQDTALGRMNLIDHGPYPTLTPGELKRQNNEITRSLVGIGASVVFILFSAYGLKGVVRKLAMKKFMDQIEHKSPSARAIAQDPEAAALAKIAEWEQEEAAAHAQPVA